MYKIIDDNEEQMKFDEVVNKITPQTLGLNPTTDFEQYAQEEIINDNPEKVKGWIDKGSIGILEAGERFEYEFNGTYDNIDNNANLNKAELALKNSNYNNIVDERIENAKIKKAEREKRISDGTASILDKIGSGFDKWGEASYQAQLQNAQTQEDLQKPHKNDTSYRYNPAFVSKAGNIIYSETDLKKKIGFSEALADSIGRGKAMPLFSGAIEGATNKKFRDITDRIKNNEAIRQDELDFVNHYLDRQNEEYVRGYTIGGAIGKSYLPSLMAFGSEIALGGAVLKGLGLAGSGTALGVNVGANLLKTGKVSKGVAKGVALTTGTLAEAGMSAGVTTAINPSRIFATYQERRLNDEMKITDRGTVIFKESKETPAKAFMKSLGQVYISYFAEGLGGLITGAGRGIKSIGATQFENVIKASPVLERFVKKSAPILAKAYEKLNGLPIKGKTVDWLKGQVKFDGFIEELGEEVLEDILNLSFGTNNEERSLENYISKIKKSPEEWAVLCGVIALQGSTLSIAGNALGTYMETNGSSFEDISNVLTNSTENERIELIDEAIKNGTVQINDNALYDETEAEKTEVEENVYNKLLKGNVSEDVAFSNAKLVGQFFSKWNKKGQEIFKKAVENLDVRYNVPKDNNKVFEQSAYHGTPHRFDNFSLEHIGSGEGAQVHGWGLYFAGKKDVSEGYRETLIKNNSYKFTVNGAEINEVANNYLVNNLNGHLLYTSANNENTKDLIEDIEFHKRYLQRGEKSVISLINLLQEQIDKIESNPKLSIAKFLSEVPEEEKYRFQYLVNASKKGAKEEGRKANIQDVLKWIKEQQKPFKIEREKQLEALAELEKLDLQNIKLEKDLGQLFEVDIPEDEVLLDEQKSFLEQSEKVQEAIKKLVIDNNFDEYIYIETKKDFLKKVEKVAGSEGVEIANEIIDAELSDVQEDIEVAWDKWNELEYKLNIDVNDFDMNSVYRMLRAKDYSGKNLYNDLSKLLGSDKEASELLNQYGIKGITYSGLRDGRCYVIFDDKAIDVVKTYYQEANEEEAEEKLIAGYTYPQVLDKLTELYSELSGDKKLSKEEEEKLMAKIHVLEDAFEVAENSDKFRSEDKRHEIMLNAYYIMNNQELPQEYVDIDKVSQRTYSDYVKLHKEKKEKKESEYYGYYNKVNEKSYITIMQNSNASTALHELAHFFLEALNDVAKVDENARKQLDEVNNWLGYSGEYTVAQHEKFARSFEAYLYRGKAPNNSLKQVFENFKEWLRSAYEHIMDLVDKGADITPEVTEMFDRLFSDDQYYEESKQTKELLKKVKAISRKEKVSKVAVRDDNSLDEVEKRHKEVCYEIVSKGTGKSVKYLKTIFETSSNRKSFAKKREAIEMLLDSVDDKITVQDGFQKEWSEFFSDTGVSYENDEIDGDYKLVEQALDVILNKAYRNPEKEANTYMEDRALYYENAISEADRQYKVLISSYKHENRNVALSAIYEWLEGLDREIKQDYEDRFVFDSAIIDREDKVDKFEKAKRRILAKAMEVENSYNISSDQKYKEVVIEIMNSLNFLNPLDKAKLTTNILDVPSLEFLMASIDNIMDVAKTMEDVAYRRKLEREIHKELQGTKNIRKSGRSVGKYDYKTNKLFEELRSLDRLSPEQANELRLDAGKFASAEEKGLSFKDKLVMNFLSYKAGGRTYANTDLMKELYDAIVKIKLVGKSAKSELELMEQLDETKDVEELIDIVTKKKKAKTITTFYHDAFANLETAVNLIFNKDIKEKYASEILHDSTVSTAWAWEQKQKVQDEIAEIYNLPKWNWDRQIIKYLAEKHTFDEIRRKYDEKGELLKTRVIPRELSKMDIINIYIQSMNEVGEKRLKNQFGQETLDTILDEMSLEDVKLAEVLLRTVQSFYDMINKTYIKKYGLDLPKVSNYFPFTPERISDVETFNEYSAQSYSFTKSRANSELIPMDFHNPLQIVFNHIDSVAKFCFMSDGIDKANKVFKNADLKRAIINKYGDSAYKTLEQQLLNITNRKQNAIHNGLDKITENLASNWISANVMVKVSTGVKQLLSACNYSTEMPYATWVKGYLKALSKPKETIDYMMKIPYLKARFHGGYSNEALKQFVDNANVAQIKSLKNFLALNIKLGDMGAIVFGGKPYIDYLINEKGLTETEAIKQFVLSTNRTQQSGEIASLSNYQVSWSRSPILRVLTAYRNSQQQYVRMCGDALVSVANGEMSKEQCAKIIFNFAFLQPFMFEVATTGSLLRMILTGDDDDFWNDVKKSIFNLGADSLAFLGEAWRYAVSITIAGGKKKQNAELPMYSDIIREINRLSKEDIELSDFLKFLGTVVGKLGFGVDVNHNIGNSLIGGTADIIDGKPIKGALRLYGMTENRAKHITGERK